MKSQSHCGWQKVKPHIWNKMGEISPQVDTGTWYWTEGQSIKCRYCYMTLKDNQNVDNATWHWNEGQ